MRPGAKKKLSPKVCACGCGETFTPIRGWQIYVSTKHRQSAWREAHVCADVVSAIKEIQGRLSVLEAALKNFRKEV